MKVKLFIICIIIFGCSNPVNKFSRKSKDEFLQKGDWLDISDTVNGISVRNNLIAYFENMQFTSDEIDKYYIIDSVYEQSKKETVKGEYLIVTNPKDSLIFKIIKRDKKVIILEDSNGKQKVFKFWR
jgi:hypothetical protein